MRVGQKSSAIGRQMYFPLAGCSGSAVFTREMNAAISCGLCTSKPVRVVGALRVEIEHWLFLKDWDNPLPWRDERHVRILLATDGSQAGWGGTLLTPVCIETSDYWSAGELSWDIARKEAIAIHRVLASFGDYVHNTWVDVSVDNQAVIHAWNNQGGRSPPLNEALKKLFFVQTALNVALSLSICTDPLKSGGCSFTKVIQFRL